jgi:hypothetical protein
MTVPAIPKRVGFAEIERLDFEGAELRRIDG